MMRLSPGKNSCMYLILDACTVINLLQVDLLCEDDDCKFEYGYLDKMINTNFEIKITEKVFTEIQTNYKANLTYRYEIDTLGRYIHTDVKKYTYLELDIDAFRSILAFVKTSTGYVKDNGELHSTAYALYLSRYEYADDKSLMLQTYFATDDDGAYNDFVTFFKLNQLGNIFTTLDLLMLLHLKNLFSFNHILNFAHNLKKQYVANLNEVLQEIKNIQKRVQSKQSSLLSKLHRYVNKLNFEEISNLMEDTLYKNIKKEHKSIDALLKILINSDMKKVAILDAKIKEIKTLYWSSAQL